MESLHVSTDLIDESKTKHFGNMIFYNYGRVVLNRKMIGFYFTFLLIIWTYAFLTYLIFNIFSPEEKSLKIWSLIVLTVSTCLTLFQTIYVSFSNPGFIKPEQKDLENDPHIKTLVATIGKRNVFLKYCKTCKIIKDVRVFHCKYCDLCIVRHDHHCPWLSNCIGINNHKRFLVLIAMSIVHCIMKFLISFIIIQRFDLNSANEKLKPSFINFNYSIALIMCSIILVSFVLLLLVIFFQMKFISNNETTSENIRRLSNIKNPFNKGCKNNLGEFFKDIKNYKTTIVYNEAAQIYLRNISLISEYLTSIERKNSINSKINENTDKIIDVDTTDKSEKIVTNFENSIISVNTLDNLMESSIDK